MYFHFEENDVSPKTLLNVNQTTPCVTFSSNTYLRYVASHFRLQKILPWLSDGHSLLNYFDKKFVCWDNRYFCDL